jgi:hypothetical protein
MAARLTVVDPAADWSISDVYHGLVEGLQARRAEVVQYRFGRRYAALLRGLMAAWKSGDPTRAKPTPADAALWTSELAITWALRHQTPWLVIVSGMYFHPDGLLLAKRAGLKVAVLLTESPYDFEAEVRVGRAVDLVWTNERTAVEPLRANGVNAHYLRHAYRPSVHTTVTALDDEVPAHDVVFVGTGFRERIDLLSAVDWTGIDFGLYGAWNLKKRSPLRAHLRGQMVDNTVTAQLYRKAKIGINLFRSSKGFGLNAPRLSGAESLGPRSYELAATGCFHVSHGRAEVAETFGPLVPTFDTAEELTGLLREWLPRVSDRAAIAAQLPGAVRGHSWNERAGQVLSDLSAHALAPSVPWRQPKAVGA